MGGFAIKHSASTITFTGTKYQGNYAGTKHLYIKTGPNTTDTVCYPLTTDVSASTGGIAFKVGTQTCYLASRVSGNQETAGYFNDNITTASQQVSINAGTTQGMNSANNYAQTSTTFKTYYTKYSITNQAGNTYTASASYNNYGVTSSKTATQTVNQSTIELITSTAQQNNYNYQTDNSIMAGSTIYNSNIVQVEAGTQNVQYQTTRSSGYITTALNSIPTGGTFYDRSTQDVIQNSQSTKIESAAGTGNNQDFFTNFNATGNYAYESVYYSWNNLYNRITQTTSFGGGNWSVISSNTLYTYMTRYGDFYLEEPYGTGNATTFYEMSQTGTVQGNYGTFYGSTGTGAVQTLSARTTTRYTSLIESIYAQTNTTAYVESHSVDVSYGYGTYSPGAGSTTYNYIEHTSTTGTTKLTKSSAFQGNSNPPSTWSSTQVTAQAWSYIGSARYVQNSVTTSTSWNSSYVTNYASYWIDRWGRSDYSTKFGWEFFPAITSVSSKMTSQGSLTYTTTHNDTFNKNTSSSLNVSSYTGISKAKEEKITYYFSKSSSSANGKITLKVTYKHTRSVSTAYTYSTYHTRRSITGVTDIQYGLKVDKTWYWSYNVTKTFNTVTNSTRYDISFRLHSFISSNYISTQGWKYTYSNQSTNWYSTSRQSQYNTQSVQTNYSNQTRYTFYSSTRLSSKITKSYSGTTTYYSFTRTTSSHNANI